MHALSARTYHRAQDSADPSLVEPVESEEDILLETFLRGAFTFGVTNTTLKI